MVEFGKPLTRHETPIKGLVWFDLPVHGDARGWFKENWQQEKMTAEAVGLPDFGPVQNNVSFNAEAGVTRGLHAEPWDKYVSLGSGKIFGAWCDVREGSETFGRVFTLEMTPDRAIYVPRGVANGFQALEDNTVYMYLVNDHWSANPPEGVYSFVNLADPALGIEWPISLDEAEISDKDKNHPNLAEAVIIKPKKTLIVGAGGQLGKALKLTFPDADTATRDELDVSDRQTVLAAKRWRDYGLILNAAAYTDVDGAETESGRRDAWRANAVAVANLAEVARENGITLVHISSDYVFDGSDQLHVEDEAFSPLGVYGQSKAAGDIAAKSAPKHYIIRTSWVIGEGKNFVRTMADLASRGIAPSVVSDQVGRLTFTDTLADAIKHLVTTQAPFGTYNVTNDGPTASWAAIASRVFELTGHNPSDVTPVTTAEYFAGKTGIAPRPPASTLLLAKLKVTGFSPEDWQDKLARYLA